jgi:hypothetical protein
MPKQEKTTCPVCEHPSTGESICPVCGWELFAKEILLLNKSQVQTYEARLHHAHQQWQEALARFQKGEMDIPNLRSHLQSLGFQTGLAFEEYVRQRLPGPFGGNAFLGIEVQGLPTGQEAEITINGYPVGTTSEGYLALRGLRVGRLRLEAFTPTHWATREIQVSEGAVLRVELLLQLGKGRLRVLSLIGGLTVKIGEQSVPAPCEMEVEAGSHTVVLERRG